MFKSLFGVIEDVVTVVAAPIEITADLAKAITEPIAEGAQEIVKTVKELTDREN